MKKVILSIIFTLVVLVIAILAYIWSGTFNVSQMVPHKSITQWVINKTTQYSIEKRIKGITVPALTDTAMIAVGLDHYNEMCVICHGGPGIEPSEMTKGLYPEPPVFYKSEMPTPEGAFWIIKNGMKMTSMPAFGPTHSDDKIWAITAFMLKKMNSISPADYQELLKKSSLHDDAQVLTIAPPDINKK
jgi:mono/diheme cytochrome c family protein